MLVVIFVNQYIVPLKWKDIDGLWGNIPLFLKHVLNISTVLVRFGLMYRLLTWRTAIFCLSWFRLSPKTIFFFFQLAFIDCSCCYSFLKCSNSFAYDYCSQHTNALHVIRIIKQMIILIDVLSRVTWKYHETE